MYGVQCDARSDEINLARLSIHSPRMHRASCANMTSCRTITELFKIRGQSVGAGPHDINLTHDEMEAFLASVPAELGSTMSNGIHVFQNLESK